MFRQLGVMLKLTRSHGIARRYFIVNGFDGALTMLGLISGFYVSGNVDFSVVHNACLGAAIALGMSGLSSAYISEAAEKRKELRELEEAMVTDLGNSAYGQAARLIPLVIGLINGLAPLLISLVVILSLWLAHTSAAQILTPLESAFLTALLIIFLLGILLGRISGTFWLWAALRTLLIAVATVALVFVLSPR